MAGEGTIDGVSALGLLDDEAILLDEAALALAALDNPDADLAAYRRQIALWTARLLARDAGVGAADRARALAAVLADEGGFVGDDRTYDDPANADLIRVIDRRRGLPVALAILYVALARRVGWTAEALNVPGHVLIRIGADADSVLVDPFDRGRILAAHDVRELLARMLGRDARPEPAHFAALGNCSTLVRLLSNQATRARQAGDVARALELHERMTAIAPAFSGLWWERARLEQLLGRVVDARASLSSMLETTRDPALRRRIAAALDALARSIN
ncbi:MAG: transglutaminase family protein [Alphaproteobacteria bacterium]|nr:transglutaminase family protein [Alphaproteobacteria bacterium]